MEKENMKLSSDEVPQKFMEWLLAMGCPQNKVPKLDNAKQICRGQYYIVWRSLMEEVESKNIIKLKKQTVFIDDIKQCKRTIEYKKNVTVPKELSLWEEHNNVKKRLKDAENSLKETKMELERLVEKVPSKLGQRKSSQNQVQNAERKVLLLQKVSEQLCNRKSDLQETMKIAKSLSYIEGTEANEGKLDKCLTLMRQSTNRVHSQSVLSANNATVSSIISTSSNDGEYEELVSTLVRCRGDSLWPRVLERRVALCGAVSQAATQHVARNSHRLSAKSILAHTSALHCNVALEAIKNKALMNQAQQKLATAVTRLNTYLSGDACEHLVRECERIRSQTRVETLRTILEELKNRSGIFEAIGRTPDKNSPRRMIANVDRNIITKKDELKKLLLTLQTTDRKISNVRDCLKTVFSCLQNRSFVNQLDKYKGQISLPQECIEQLQKFYDEKRSSRKTKLQLSFDLDMSAGNSLNENTENGSPTFTDELKIYLDNFYMEKNRKLILENGEKLWVFETLQALLHKLNNNCLSEDVLCTFVCPSVDVVSNINVLSSWIHYKEQLQDLLCKEESGTRLEIDITSQIEEENELSDKFKKRLNESLLRLQKIDRILDVGVENLEFWQNNNLNCYINKKRVIEGKNYSEYESLIKGV